MPESLIVPSEVVFGIPEAELEKMLAEDEEEDRRLFNEVFPYALATLLNSTDE
jgi:hypothetical protein